jgi:hypothetical protein
LHRLVTCERRRQLGQRSLDLRYTRSRFALAGEKGLRIVENPGAKRTEARIEGFTRLVVLADPFFQRIPAPDVDEHLAALGLELGCDDARQFVHFAVIGSGGDDEIFSQRRLEVDRLLDLVPHLLL